MTHSYLASCHDSYITFKKVINERGGINTYLGYAMSFVDYVKKHKTIDKLPEEELSIQCYIDENHTSCEKE